MNRLDSGHKAARELNDSPVLCGTAGAALTPPAGCSFQTALRPVTLLQTIVQAQILGPNQSAAHVVWVH